MPRVLAISSQVARGHVGLSAIVPALQALGHEVIALPTVLLSNHPGHAHVAGERVAPDVLRRMLDALAANGWLGGIDTVLTGYLPSAEHVRFAADAVRAVRQANPQAIVLVDPVLGDDPKGLYIELLAAKAVRDMLLPAASYIKLNAFELAWLAGQPIPNADAATSAVRSMCWPATVVTSVPGGTGVILNLLIDGDAMREAFGTKILPAVPKGTGDLFSGLLLGHLLKRRVTTMDAFKRAFAGVSLAVQKSAGEQELLLVRNLRAIANAKLSQVDGAP